MALARGCLSSSSFEMATGGKHTSYEPKRCKAYSSDLHWRMVYQRQCLGLTYEAIGNLGVDQSTVHRTVNLFFEHWKCGEKEV